MKRIALVVAGMLLWTNLALAQKKSRVTVQVVETLTVQRTWTNTTPGTQATHEPGTPRSITQERVHAIMADGRHVTLWCEKVFRRCDYLQPGSYSAEVKGNTVWIYVLDLSSKEHKIRYKVADGDVDGDQWDCILYGCD